MTIWEVALVGILAQAAATDPTFSVLAQYGALGFIAGLALLAVRVLFLRETRSLDLERARADRYEEELRRLNEAIHQRYIPAITSATEVIMRASEQFRKDDRR